MGRVQAVNLLRPVEWGPLASLCCNDGSPVFPERGSWKHTSCRNGKYSRCGPDHSEYCPEVEPRTPQAATRNQWKVGREICLLKVCQQPVSQFKDLVGVPLRSTQSLRRRCLWSGTPAPWSRAGPSPPQPLPSQAGSGVGGRANRAGPGSRLLRGRESSGPRIQISCSSESGQVCGWSFITHQESCPDPFTTCPKSPRQGTSA